MNGKSFIYSKTFWGLMASALGMVLPEFGVGISGADLQHLFESGANVFTAAMQFGGLAYALYGRAVAKGPLTVK